jgi:DNA invertase Pin-like site-specific DNA recombinase
MTMSIAAYLRVSTGQQSIDQQHDAIAAAGITPDRVFTDTASGRAGSDRPGWRECSIFRCINASRGSYLYLSCFVQRL